VVSGRWAAADRDDDPQFHVRAEFHAEGVGWVPVDGSGAVLWAGAPASAFGVHRADFLVMHLDTDLGIDTLFFGEQALPWLQGPAFWVRGAGTLDGHEHASVWRVREGARAR
jgi:transglutaminase-like putative cysteine protease